MTDNDTIHHVHLAQWPQNSGSAYHYHDYNLLRIAVVAYEPVILSLRHSIFQVIPISMTQL